MTVPPIPLADALRDRYRFERELGRGGMGTVYLVDDLRHERPVALKVLHPELAATLGPERFLREIRLAARLQHPHLLSVHDSGDAAGRLWFTMPYIEGESLRDRLRRDRQLPVEEAVLIAQQAARALDYAHRHGVLHRDIKPENILLTEDGEALVADFGIGRALGAADADERLTETGLVVGTPAYMSPEQAAGERQLDGRSDLYSLGCVLYEMLAGEPPFTGPTAQAIVARRLTETPRPLGQARETVTAELERVVSTALARAPADRHADGAAFAAALAAALESTGRTAAAPSPTEARPVAIAARPRRRRWIVGIAAAAIAAALAAALLRGRAGTAPAADQSLVAVAPFDVLDPALALWREGLVDLLSRNLDGAGPLRSVAPTTVIRRWEGRADPESAAELGRRTGAGLALYGSVLRAGPDSVRIRATLYDVARGRPVEEWEVTDGVDRVDRAADSLTIRVLEGLGRTRPIGAVRLAGFGSTSLPALKAFLQGEQHLRLTEWDSALGYYERAIALDSTFAPALRRASTALGWIRTGTDSLSTAYALRAGAHNNGLSPRDSLLVAADSLFASVIQAGSLGLHADSGWGVRLRRVFTTLEQATARYPDDAEAWFALGEASNHIGPYAGRAYERQLEAFDRVIALDSAFAPAYIHPIEQSAGAGPDAIRRYLRPYLALTPVDVNADGARLVQRLLDSAGRATDIDGRLQGISDQGPLQRTRCPEPAAGQRRAGRRALAIHRPAPPELLAAQHAAQRCPRIGARAHGPRPPEGRLRGSARRGDGPVVRRSGPARRRAGGDRGGTIQQAALGGHRGVRGTRRRVSLVGRQAGHRVPAPCEGACRFAGAGGAAVGRASPGRIRGQFRGGVPQPRPRRHRRRDPGIGRSAGAWLSGVLSRPGDAGAAPGRRAPRPGGVADPRRRASQLERRSAADGDPVEPPARARGGTARRARAGAPRLRLGSWHVAERGSRAPAICCRGA